MRRILAAAVLASTAALAGCASEPPIVSDKVQAYYNEHTSMPTAPARTRPLMVMIGDSFTAGNDETPGAAKYGFADRAADALGWDRTNLAQGGTGYVNPGANDSTIYAGVVARAVDLNPDILLVGGGINDTKYPTDQTAVAADALYKDLKSKLPQAKIVVMGPITPGGPDGEYRAAVGIRDVLKAAAEANALPFIDPIAEDWMPTKAGLVGPTNFHPNAAGHEMLATELAADLEALGLSD